MSYELDDTDPLGGSLIPKHTARFADGQGGAADDVGDDHGDHALGSSMSKVGGASSGGHGPGGGSGHHAQQQVFTYAEVNNLVTAVSSDSVRQRYSALVSLGAPARSLEWQSVVGNRLGRKGIATVFRDLSNEDRGMRVAAAKLVCDLAFGNAENQQLISFHAGFTVGHVRVFTSPRNLRQIFGTRKIVDNSDLQSALEDFVSQFPATKNRRFWCYPPYKPNLSNLFPDPDAYLIGFYTFDDPESIPIFRVPTRAEAAAAMEARAGPAGSVSGSDTAHSRPASARGIDGGRIAVSSPPSRKTGKGRPQTSTGRLSATATSTNATLTSTSMSSSSSSSTSGKSRGGGVGGAGSSARGKRPATATARIGGGGGSGSSSGGRRPGSAASTPRGGGGGGASKIAMMAFSGAASSGTGKKKRRGVSARGPGGGGGMSSNSSVSGASTVTSSSVATRPSSTRPKSAPSLRASRNMQKWREAANRAGAAKSAMSRTFWDSIDAETHMSSSNITSNGTINLILHPAVAGYKWNSAVAQRRILAMRSEAADSTGRFTDGIKDASSLGDRPGSARPKSARPASARPRSARGTGGGSGGSSGQPGGIVSTGPGAGDRKQFAVDVYSSPFKSLGPSMHLAPADPATTMLDFQNMLVNSERQENADTGERKIRRTDTIVGLVVPGAQVSSGSLTLDKMAVNDMRIARRNARASQAAAVREGDNTSASAQAKVATM